MKQEPTSTSVKYYAIYDPANKEVFIDNKHTYPKNTIVAEVDAWVKDEHIFLQIEAKNKIGLELIHKRGVEKFVKPILSRIYADVLSAGAVLDQAKHIIDVFYGKEQYPPNNKVVTAKRNAALKIAHIISSNNITSGDLVNMVEKVVIKPQQFLASISEKNELLKDYNELVLFGYNNVAPLGERDPVAFIKIPLLFKGHHIGTFYLYAVVFDNEAIPKLKFSIEDNFPIYILAKMYSNIYEHFKYLLIKMLPGLALKAASTTHVERASVGEFIDNLEKVTWALATGVLKDASDSMKYEESDILAISSEHITKTIAKYNAGEKVEFPIIDMYTNNTIGDFLNKYFNARQSILTIQLAKEDFEVAKEFATFLKEKQVSEEDILVKSHGGIFIKRQVIDAFMRDKEYGGDVLKNHDGAVFYNDSVPTLSQILSDEGLVLLNWAFLVEYFDFPLFL